MQELIRRFAALKTSVGGNREKSVFHWTFGPTPEEMIQVTPPAAHIQRILAQLEYAIKLVGENGGDHGPLEEALAILEGDLRTNGVLTRDSSEAAERALLPLAEAAKSYEVLCVAHAHIDMDWMWSFDETVAITLATFRTMLTLMEEYPDFCFSQSQASVYRIVETYAPEMMEPIRQRIREGRWEVTAAAWVETDKNMPDTESLLRHIRMTKQYMHSVWGVDPASLKVDFSPDTFGHSAQVPEINNFGSVPYYYHCRGRATEDVLYRWRAPSGREVLVYREPYWYNSGITKDIGTGIFEISKHSGGLKTGLIVYGVGDHGGGPTRRDIEKILAMREWPVFPKISFGTLHAYFDRAQSVREALPVVDRELNTIFTGCYTTQSRIKRGNRRAERALLDAEAVSAMAHFMAEMPWKAQAVDPGWEDVLYTHFHDILPGSCVQDSREHALGLYQEAMARARTAQERAMRTVSDQADTSMIPMDPADSLQTQSEGAGVGFGAQGLSVVSAEERGRGRVRIFHVFNPGMQRRRELVELRVWDWTHDLRRIQVTDENGEACRFQIVDSQQQRYWDHQYFRLLVEVEVPSAGYATLALREAPLTEYVTPRLADERIQHPEGAFVLENEWIVAVFDGGNGGLVSLVEKATGKERIRPGEAAGVRVMMTEKNHMGAWTIGRHLSDMPPVHTIHARKSAQGQLRQSIQLEQKVLSSTIHTTVSLDAGASELAYAVEVDWHEAAADHGAVPVLMYSVPLKETPDCARMDIPAGSIDRIQEAQDKPALTHTAAVYGGRALALVTDSKYGYRMDGDILSATLINTADHPDPYPERGKHTVALWLHAGGSAPSTLKRAAVRLTHALPYVSARPHGGALPPKASFAACETENVVISSMGLAEDGALIVRLYEAEGKDGQATLWFVAAPKRAELIDLDGAPGGEAGIEGQRVIFAVRPYRIVAVKVVL